MKISALPTATTPLSGAELFPLVQSGNTRRVTLNDLLRSIGNGTAAAPALAPGGDPNTGIYFPAADTIGFVEGGVEVWRMSSSGHFLAATDNSFDIGASGANRPRDLFVARNATFGAVGQVAADTVANASLTIANNSATGSTLGTASLFFRHALTSPAGAIRAGRDSDYSTGANSDSHLAFFTAENNADVERMRLTSGGNLGLNTTPLTRLHIKGTGTSSGVKLTLSNGGEIAALNDPLGVIDFFSDDVSTGASGIKGYLGVYNQFNGNWDGSLVRHLTYMAFATSFDSVVAERMRIDASGNLGLGVIPSSWGSTWRAFQFGASGALANNGGNSSFTLASNARNNGSNWLYLNSDAAAAYSHLAGVHSWSVAPSGTAGNAITFTQAMTLDASGNLLLGTTSGNLNANNQALTVRSAQSGSTSAAVDIGGYRTTDGTVGQLTYFNGANLMALVNVSRRGADNSGALEFYTANAGSVAERWRVSSSGHFLAGVDNTYDIGASGATRPRTVYAATSVEGGYIRAGAASAGAASTTTIGNGTATTVGAAGAASALPANPLGYIIAHVGTTQVKIPYYNN